MATKNKKLNELLKRFESQVERLEKMKFASGGGGGGGGSGGSGGGSGWFDSYNEFYKEKVAPFVKFTKGLGGPYVALSKRIAGSFTTMKELLEIASKSKKPSGGQIADFYKPINMCIKEWDDARFALKGKPEYDHYGAMMEGMKALQWVGIRDTPFKWIKEAFNQSTFWSNKVLRSFRSKDKRHVEWVGMIKTVILGLEQWVKDHHMTGLRWNAKGAKATPPSGGGGGGGGDDDEDDDAPPPIDDLEFSVTSNTGGDGDDKPDMSDALAQIKKGGIKLKSSKGRKLGKKVAPKKKAQPKKKAKKKEEKYRPPRLEFDGGKRWDIEHWKDNKNVTLEANKCKVKHIVYIFKCHNSNIFIKGKVSKVCCDKCTNCAVVVNDIVAAVELVQCKDLRFQVDGKCPTMTVDGCDTLTVYVKKPSFEVDMLVAKTSAFNFCPMFDDDYDEIAVPEQFSVKYHHGKKGKAKLSVEPKREG